MPYENDLYTPGYSSLENAVGDTYTRPKHHTCNFCRPCKYPHPSREICGEIVNCSAVSDHFRERHNIVDLTRREPIRCWWLGCKATISRHNFVRHIREQHLFHSRG